MKQCLNNNFNVAEHSTLEPNTTDFNWKLLYSRLNEETTGAEIDPTVIEAVVRLLKLFVNTPKRKIRPDQVGLRVIALAWILNPGYFPDSPSLRQLARRCGVSPAALGALTAHYSRMIGWRSRAQRRAWNWRRSERRT